MKLQTVWNFDPLFKGDDDPAIDLKLKEVQKVWDGFIKKWKGNKEYLHKPEVMLKALDEYEALVRNYGFDGGAFYYFSLRMSQEEGNSELRAKFTKVSDFCTKLRNQTQFFGLAISRIPKQEQKKFLSFKGLEKYKHWLETSFDSGAHVLSDHEEVIMNLKYWPAHNHWVHMVSSFLSAEEREVLGEDGKKGKKSFSEITSLLSSQNKKVRDKAAEAFNEVLLKHRAAAEAEINAILLNKKSDDELRNFKRADGSRHLSDDIDSEVVDRLVKTVSARNDIARKFYSLKARMMGVKKLAYHERSVPYGKIDEKYKYEEAVSLVSKVFSRLDKEFLDIFNGFVNGGNVDVFPRKGKRGGAFCDYNIPTQPTYLLLNHSDKLQDVLTMAHESGHGINNELIKKKQNALNFGTPLSTAEVASTFMEDFVLEELEMEANDERKLALMMMKLNDDISTIFRQIACYKFELDLHKAFRDKGFLSAEEIGEIFRKNMSAYMGDSVEQTNGSENWWVYWSHIRNFFYVYSYASGLLISKYLQAGVRKNKSFVKDVKVFLSAGLSESPKEIFSRLGADITSADFWNTGIDEIEKLLNDTEKLAKKLGKI